MRRNYDAFNITGRREEDHAIILSTIRTDIHLNILITSSTSMGLISLKENWDQLHEQGQNVNQANV
jgi:hypothetical protein